MIDYGFEILAVGESRYKVSWLNKMEFRREVSGSSGRALVAVYDSGFVGACANGDDSSLLVVKL